jgi:hypothetical protein
VNDALECDALKLSGTQSRNEATRNDKALRNLSPIGTSPKNSGLTLRFIDAIIDKGIVLRFLPGLALPLSAATSSATSPGMGATVLLIFKLACEPPIQATCQPNRISVRSLADLYYQHYPGRGR